MRKKERAIIISKENKNNCFKKLSKIFSLCSFVRDGKRRQLEIDSEKDAKIRINFQKNHDDVRHCNQKLVTFGKTKINNFDDDTGQLNKNVAATIPFDMISMADHGALQ